MPRPGDADEIFTDLHGNPDPVDDKDLSVLDEDDLGQVPESGKKKAEVDPDLLVDDEDEDEDAAAAAAAAAAADEDDEGEDEEDEEEAPADVGQASDFDPKDVQIVLLETRNLEGRENTEKANKDRATADIAAAEAAMLKAKEDGDSKADVAATKAFAAATVALDKAEAELRGIEDEKRALASRARELLNKAPKNEKGEAILDGSHRAAPTRTEAPAKPKGSKLVPKFVEKNAWFSDPKYAAQAATLRGIDAGLAAEKKLNKNDPAYWEEMGRRFNKVYPGLYKGLDGKVVATGQRQRGSGTPVPGSGGGGGNANTGGSGGKVKLTREDLTQMPKFGMDPNNMEHRKIWLTEKRAQERAA